MVTHSPGQEKVSQSCLLNIPQEPKTASLSGACGTLRGLRRGGRNSTRLDQPKQRRKSGSTLRSETAGTYTGSAQFRQNPVSYFEKRAAERFRYDAEADATEESLDNPRQRR